MRSCTHRFNRGGPFLGNRIAVASRCADSGSPDASNFSFMARGNDSGGPDRSHRPCARHSARDRGRPMGWSYLWLGALDTLGQAMLFSVDSMTTRGASGGAASALAGDGCAGGGRRHADVWHQHGLHFRRYGALLAGIAGLSASPIALTTDVMDSLLFGVQIWRIL
jgi:hypothetical protein